jgi:hypothetical protein
VNREKNASHVIHVIRDPPLELDGFVAEPRGKGGSIRLCCLFWPAVEFQLVELVTLFQVKKKEEHKYL